MSPADQLSPDGQKLVQESLDLYAGKGGSSPKAVINVSAESTATPDSITSAGATASQGPPGSRIAQAPASAIRAGRSSQFTNDKAILPTSNDSLARGRPDEGGATGYVTDDEYGGIIEQYNLLDAESNGFASLSKVSVDERGQQITDVVTARSVMTELDAQEQVLRNIETCTRGAA